jgi:ABC-type transport system involved in multi-copper enzyme maturation permease subunit
MFHGTWTLLSRSIRLDALQWRAHAFRILSAGVVLLLLIATHIYTAGRGSPGLAFFALICHLCIGLITVAAAGHFSTAITEEKEAGTLDLLLLANVPALAILVGKSTTRIVSTLLVFVAIFPFALLALALGGATVHQVWSGLVALAGSLVLVANLGLFASVTRRSATSAAVITTALLVLLLGAPLMLKRASSAVIKTGWATTGSPLVARIDEVQKQLNELSVVTRINRIQQTGFDDSAWSPQVRWSLAVGALLFVLSWALFRRFCEYLGDDPRSRGALPRVASTHRRRRTLAFTPRTWGWALAWKDFHFLVGGVPGLLIRGGLIPLVAGGMFAVDRFLSAGMNLTTPDALRIGILLAAGLELVSLASRLFNSEYRGHTLCTLALLPRSTVALCYGKLLGGLLVLVPYALWFLALGAQHQVTLNQLASIYLLEPSAAIGGCLLLVLIHLTAWLSLHLKWGALPLATIILMVLTSCLWPVVAMSAYSISEGVQLEHLYTALYFTLLICAALQIAIGLRFQAAAAE